MHLLFAGEYYGSLYQRGIVYFDVRIEEQQVTATALARPIVTADRRRSSRNDCDVQPRRETQSNFTGTVAGSRVSDIHLRIRYLGVVLEQQGAQQIRDYLLLVPGRDDDRQLARRRHG